MKFMGYYFNDLDAVYSRSHGNITHTLNVMASRYMGENPKAPYTARPFTTCGIIRNKDYRYVFNGNDFYPNAKNGNYVYAWGKIRRQEKGSLKFLLIPFGPVKIWMNGKEIFATTFEDERFVNKSITFDLPVEKDWNHLVLRFTKTKAGFGAEFGTWLGKLDYYFMHGKNDYDSMEGFDFSLPTDEKFSDFPNENLSCEKNEFASKMRSLLDWNDEQKNLGVIGRIFCDDFARELDGKFAEKIFAEKTDCNFAKETATGAENREFTKEVVAHDENRQFAKKPPLEKIKNLAGKKIATRSRFKTYAKEKISLFIETSFDGEKSVEQSTFGDEKFGKETSAINQNLFANTKSALKSEKSESQKSAYKIFIDKKQVENNEIEISSGVHEILVLLYIPKSLENEKTLDFTLKIFDSQKNPLELENPFLTDNKNKKFAWIFAGPFEKTSDDSLLNFESNKLVGEKDEKTWWRLDFPGGHVRLYNENALWGHWDYPLGVTLYGLIETARLLSCDAIKTYVENHVKKTVETLEYALFDRKHFGGATCVHHLLTSIDSLDDCGSFGSLMLEVSKDCQIGDFAWIADYVGDYICKKQARLEDGSFFRKQMMHKFHNGTMWADDLYMSVPFLCRYAKFKNDVSILDDAANQFLGFKKRLFLSEKKLMAHVYDFNREMNTGVPWGRGNGWTIFSLSELLLVLPQNHKMRAELLDFFRELAEGFLNVQDENGMWHQVLDLKESYPESSCTSMFICAFSRGIRNGWLNDKDFRFRKSATKAWNALEKTAIDYKGNLYGVCRGSEFAFNPNYYSEHLLPQLNNTHGIGITLLAGVEMLKLQNFN